MVKLWLHFLCNHNKIRTMAVNIFNKNWNNNCVWHIKYYFELLEIKLLEKNMTWIDSKNLSIILNIEIQNNYYIIY